MPGQPTGSLIGNAMLTALPSIALDGLQYVQHSAARVLPGTKPWEHITPTPMQLHRLPSRVPALYSTFYCSHSSPFTLWAPRYLSEVTSPPRRRPTTVPQVL